MSLCYAVYIFQAKSFCSTLKLNSEYLGFQNDIILTELYENTTTKMKFRLM
jgi:hypothetical protein